MDGAWVATAANRRLAASSVAPIFPISTLPRSLRDSVLAIQDITEIPINHLSPISRAAPAAPGTPSLTAPPAAPHPGAEAAAAPAAVAAAGVPRGGPATRPRSGALPGRTPRARRCGGCRTAPVAASGARPGWPTPSTAAITVPGSSVTPAISVRSVTWRVWVPTGECQRSVPLDRAVQPLRLRRHLGQRLGVLQQRPQRDPERVPRLLHAAQQDQLQVGQHLGLREPLAVRRPGCAACPTARFRPAPARAGRAAAARDRRPPRSPASAIACLAGSDSKLEPPQRAAPRTSAAACRRRRLQRPITEPSASTETGSQ